MAGLTDHPLGHSRAVFKLLRFSFKTAPDHKSSDGKEAARHKHGRATCSGTVLTLPFLQENTKPMWDWVFFIL